MEKASCKVCVTGRAGYVASLVVKKLLDEGYVVHATLGNLGVSTLELLAFDEVVIAKKMEVLTLACGLVGGETLMPYKPGSVTTILSLLTNDEFAYNSLKFLEQLIAKVPLVHIEDVSNALIFCMNEPSVNGRLLCSNGYVSTAEMASYYQKKYPEFNIKKEYLECNKRDTKWGSTLLSKMGFECKYDWHMVLDDSLSCAKKMQISGSK